MGQKWTYLLGAAGVLIGVWAGHAFGQNSAFCAPGLLQGNPICLGILLFTVTVGAAIAGFGGAAVGRLLDGPEEPPADPPRVFIPGPGARTGARIGLALTGGAYVTVWLTGGLEGVVALQQHPWGWAIIAPIVLAIGIGHAVDRRQHRSAEHERD